MQIKQIIMGDQGFRKDIFIPLTSVDLTANTAVAAYDTNGRALITQETNDSIFHLTIPVPRDYDEITDELKIRVLASQLTLSTDDDVELDSEAYVLTSASASIGSDLNPDAPGTVLAVIPQWIEFDLSGNSLTRDDVINFELITNGANDTNAEEVATHAIQLSYVSTLVSYDEVNASNVALR